jgi:ribosomal protein S18 acetylase RimI-like enzyme
MNDSAAPIRVREARREDQPFLALMMFYAAHMDEEGKEPSAAAVMELSAAAQYVADWGRRYDLGFLALESKQDLRVGAAWLRLYRSDARAFGYVDDVTPELAIGVLPDYRGKGVGGLLLQKLMSEAAANHKSVSLNVGASNVAVRLYERLGFVKLHGSDMVNRVGGHSFNMIAKLRA